jgi:tetratricopeptide (TPR) repeat protein
MKSKRTLMLLSLLFILVLVAVIVRGGLLRRFDPADRLYQQGKQLAQQGDVETALHLWRKAIQQNPSLPEPYFALADAFRERREHEAGSVLLRQLLNVSQKTNTLPKHLLCRLADMDFLSGRTKSALFFAEHGVRSEPDCFRAHHILGMLLDMKGDSQGALRHLEEAHRLQPDEEELALTLISVQIANFRVDDARRTARAILQHHPKSAEAYYWLGWTHANHQKSPDDLRQAAKFFEKSIALNPSLAGAYGEWGRIALQQGELKKAKELLEKAWLLDESSERVAYHLARAYNRLGDQRAATIWKAFRRLSARRERLEALHKRQTLDPTNVLLTLETARLEMEEGHTLEAMALVESVLERDPHNAEAQRLRQQLAARR